MITSKSLSWHFPNGSRTKVLYQDSLENARIIDHVPLLNSAYRPTPWLFNEHLQLIWLGLKKALAPYLEHDHLELLDMADGEKTLVYWYGLELPEDTPTIVVLHTISGSFHSMRGFVRDLQQLTGWRIAFCERRGHDNNKLTKGGFNTMGSVDDFVLQLNYIKSRFPRSRLYAAGVSAGTALLIRYLGESGRQSLLNGAFAYCPGYDIGNAFARVVPFYSRMMTKKLIKKFILPNEHLFAGLDSYAQLIGAQNLHEFHRYLYECAGYFSYQDYISDCNPALVIDRVEVPLLVLNAEDDPICRGENVYEHQDRVLNLPSSILAITSQGSHCAHFTGWSAKPWAHMLAAQYFLALDQFV